MYICVSFRRYLWKSSRKVKAAAVLFDQIEHSMCANQVGHGRWSYGGGETFAMLVLPVPSPHCFLSSFLTWSRSGEVLAQPICNAGRGRRHCHPPAFQEDFSWLDLRVIHSIPTQVSAWCRLWPPSHGIVVTTSCILASVYAGVVQLVLIATNP